MMKITDVGLSPREILGRGYVRRLAPDESGGYVASILEFPGCVAEGDSADEALQNLDSAAEAWIEVAISNGQSVRDPVDFEGYSGKTVVRMPRTLHQQAAELAELEGCSLNQFLVTAIAHFVGGKQLATKLEASYRPASTTNVHIQSLSVLAVTSGPQMHKHGLSTVAIAEQTYSNLRNLRLPFRKMELTNG